MGKQDGVRPERRENSGVFFHRRAVLHESPSAATCLRLAVLFVRGEHGSTHFGFLLAVTQRGSRLCFGVFVQNNIIKRYNNNNNNGNA